MKLLATGDIHLGQGAALGRAPGERLRDQLLVLERITDLAIDRAVDGVLIAGDVFEGPSIPPEQLDVFARFVARCRDEAIPVLTIVGNSRHDAAVRETNGLAIFDHIPGIVVSTRPSVYDFAGVTVATLPWVHPGRYIAANGGDAERDDVNQAVAELLVATARGLRAQIPDGQPSVLLMHWDISGASLPNGLPNDVADAPILDVHALEDLGFDWVVAGHVHKPQTLVTDGGRDAAFYVGSPMPLNFGEENIPHGVRIIDTAEGVAEFVPIESRPLFTLDVDVTTTDQDPHNAIVDAIENDADSIHGAIVRLRYRATADQARRIDPPILRAIVLEDGAHSVKLAPEIVRADRARVDTVTEDLSPLAAFDAWVAANDVDADVAARARVQLAEDLETVTT